MKVIRSPKEIIDKLDVIQGDTWEQFAKDMYSADQDPYTSEFIIPAELNFLIEDVPVMKDQTTHWMVTRFQICYWAFLDQENFHKPIQLVGFTSHSELRLLSGLPNVDSIILDQDEYPVGPSLEAVAFSAGDIDLWEFRG